MPAELITALLPYGLPGAALLLAGFIVYRAIEKKYEIRIGPKQ